METVLITFLYFFSLFGITNIPLFVANYIIGIVIMLAVNCFLAGFNENTPDKNDLKEAIIWPIVILTYIGIGTRYLVENILHYFQNRKSKKKVIKTKK